MSIERVTEGAVRFFFSRNVKIFPCTYRGFYETSIGNNIDRVSAIFDPESRLISEYNYTHLPGLMADKTSYVLEYIPYGSQAKPEGLLRFVINGYYFEIQDLSLDSDEEQPLTFTDLLNDENQEHISFTICTRKATISQTNTEDRERFLTYLCSQYDGCNSLDQLVSMSGTGADGSNIFYCTALALHLSDSTTNVNYFSGGSAAESSLHRLILKENGALVYENFLNKLVAAHSQNFEGGVSSDENANLELGYMATARGNNALAIGTKASTLEEVFDASGNVSETVYDCGTALGSNASAFGDSAIAIGVDASAKADGSIVIGGRGSIPSGSALTPINAKANGEDSIAIGRETDARADRAITVGLKATASGVDSIAIGKGSEANAGSDIIGSSSVAVGPDTEAKNVSTSAFGADASAVSREATALGAKATASADETTAIGTQSKASKSKAVAVGRNAKATEVNTVAIGTDTQALGSGSTVVGSFAGSSSGEGSVLVGTSTKASAKAIAVGNNASAADSAIVIGTDASATGATKAIIIGSNSKSVAGRTIAIGSDLETRNTDEILIGNGLTSIEESASCIIGNYNDSSKKDGKVCIATGTSDSDRKTSCSFGSSTGTYLYEKLNAKSDVEVVGSLNVDKNTSINGDFTAGDDTAKIMLFRDQGQDKSASTEITTSFSDNDSGTHKTTKLELKNSEASLKAEQRDGNDNVPPIICGIDMSIENGSSTLNIEADNIKIHANNSLNLKFSKGDKSLLQIMFDMAHPIDSIFQTTDGKLSNADAVSEYFSNKFGVESTWEPWGVGRVAIGAGATYENGKTGGSDSVQLTENYMPSHSHTITCAEVTLNHDKLEITTAPQSHSHTGSTGDNEGEHGHSLKTDRNKGESQWSGEFLGVNNQKGNWSHRQNITNLCAGANMDEFKTEDGKYNIETGLQVGRHKHSISTDTDTHSHTITVNINGHALHKHDMGCSNYGKGENDPFSIIQPYQVCYMYKRVEDKE
jgi:hypothetical protein